MADFSDSLEKIALGTARGIVMPPAERERTAYHESGHALLGMLTPSADPVRRITIIPRGQAVGVTYQVPEADRYDYSETYLRGRITGALGGRAAEEVIYGDVTTGAENDMDHASQIARQMVGRWGMSPPSGRSRCSPRKARNRGLAPTAWPRRPGNSSTPRPAGSSRSATPRPWPPSAATGIGWTISRTPSSSGKRWMRTRHTPRPTSALTLPRPPSSPPRLGNRLQRLVPRSVRRKRSFFPNGPWRFGPRQTATPTGASTGRARIWLSAAASSARGSLLPAGCRQAMNRSGRTRTAPSRVIWRWRCQAQRGSW